jgi:hypothetical protein
MKRKVYYAMFTLLGAMLGFFLHAIVETLYIKLLLSDFDRYGLGLSWNAWVMIHAIGVPVLVALLAWWGYRQGRKWWRVLYVEQRWMKRWGGKKLKQNF